MNSQRLIINVSQLKQIISLGVMLLLFVGCTTSTPPATISPPPSPTSSVSAQVLSPTSTQIPPSPTPMPTETTPPTETPSPTSTSTLAPLPQPPAETPSPTSTPTLTPLPQPPTVTPVILTTDAPQVISFTVAPTTTLTLGEEIVVAWDAVGTKAELCLFSGRPPDGKCEDVPLQGTKTIPITEDIVFNTGVGLRVTEDQDFVWAVSYLSLQCQGWRNWFFENPPAKCPAADPLYSFAAAQRFEHGFMLWVEETDTFYVFFDTEASDLQSGDGEKLSTFRSLIGPVRLKPGASEDNRIGETPPSGYYEPVSGFGLLWRGELEGMESIREELGWAIESEFGFDTAYQCNYSGMMARLWTCYLQGPDGKVLQLYPDSTAQVHFIWREYSLPE